MQINDLVVEVIRKKIKNMHLSVLPPNGHIRVSAPLKVTDEAIQLFVLTKYGWAKQKIREFKVQPRQTIREYISGESHYFGGERYRLTVMTGAKRNTLIFSGTELTFNCKTGLTVEQKKIFFDSYYRKKLKEKAAPLIVKWAAEIGVTVNDWQVKDMKTRWGTCNVTARRIWLNLNLAKKSKECLEYIIVHELCHLIVKNHGEDFKRLMNKHFPFWREVKKLLNEAPLDFVADDEEDDDEAELK